MPRARKPLSRERVLHAALALVDRDGLEALSMRRLAKELGVEAMSLYNHVENKEDVVAGILDLVAAEIEPPAERLSWKEALRARAVSAHDAFLRRPWAARIWMSAGRPSDDHFADADAILRRLREAGLSASLTYRAFHVFNGYILGHALQSLEFPYDDEELKQQAAAFLHTFPAEAYPDLADHIRGHADPEDDAGSFEFGLDLILDGLERCGASTPGDGRRGARRGGGRRSA